MFEYTIRILKGQIWFEAGLIDVIANPRISELQKAILILEREGKE